MLSKNIVPVLTEQQYLEMEIGSSIRHEFVDGYVFAMTGASRVHNIIALNFASEFRRLLRGTPCYVYMSDVKLKIAHLHAYYYPDVMVGCGRDEDDEYALTQPGLIVEVLSDT
ncbi:MAG: Uma2 family endonuclease, partial [Gammaproteobacteria bacterium]